MLSYNITAVLTVSILTVTAVCITGKTVPGFDPDFLLNVRFGALTNDVIRFDRLHRKQTSFSDN